LGGNRTIAEVRFQQQQQRRRRRRRHGCMCDERHLCQ
jgi:hypothetical protein